MASVHRSTRVVALAIVTIVAIAACSGDDAPAAPTAVSSTTVEPPTTPAPPTTVAPSTTVAPTTVPTTTLPPTTTTTEPLIVEGAVVLVANATRVSGAAAQLTGQLRGLGFAVAEPTNADGIEAHLDATKIYYIAGSEPVATSVARVFGGLTIEPMPTPAWIMGATDALGEATVLVMLGEDFAEAGLPPR